MQDLFDVVNQAVESPLDVNLVTSAQGKTVQIFLSPYVAENRFHYLHPLTVCCAKGKRTAGPRSLPGKSTKRERPASRGPSLGKRNGPRALTGNGAAYDSSRRGCTAVLDLVFSCGTGGLRKVVEQCNDCAV